MPRYQGKLLQFPVATTLKGTGALWASAAVRARRMALYDAVLSATGGLSSTDCQIEYDFSRFITTSLIVGTAFTPSPVDGADDATLAATTYLNNITTELASLAVAGSGLALYTMSENQRATFRWRALETYDMMVIPNAAFSGLEIRVLSPNFAASMLGVLSYLE